MKLLLLVATVLCVSAWTQGHVLRNRQSRQVIYEEESPECTTPGPDKKTGQCIPLRECKPLLTYMMTGLTQKVVSFLRDSSCGFEGNHPKVCCPPEVGLIEPVQSIGGIVEPVKSEEVTPEPAKQEATQPAVPQEATPEPSNPVATEPPAAQEATPEPPAAQEATSEPPAAQEATSEPPAAQAATSEPPAAQEATPEPSKAEATEPAVPQEATPEPSNPVATESAVVQEVTPEPSKSEPAPNIEPAEPEDDTLSCGKRSSGDSWPWLVQLTTLLSLDIATGKHSSRSCVGVLFSDQHIITTAHCTEGILISAQLGQKDIAVQDAFTALLEGSTISKVIRAPAYNKETSHNNLAVLVLENKVTFNDDIQPICLPQKPWFDGSQTMKAFPAFSDRMVVSAGWKEAAGSQMLRSISASIEDASICSEEPGSSGFGNFICAEFSEDSYCQETPGGPIMSANKNNRWHLLGLIAGSDGCGSGSTTRYTRIEAWAPWINAQTTITLNRKSQ